MLSISSLSNLQGNDRNKLATFQTYVTHWISHFQAPLGQLEAPLLILGLGFLGQGWLWGGLGGQRGLPACGGRGPGVCLLSKEQRVV